MLVDGQLVVPETVFDVVAVVLKLSVVPDVLVTTALVVIPLSVLLVPGSVVLL